VTHCKVLQGCSDMSRVSLHTNSKINLSIVVLTRGRKVWHSVPTSLLLAHPVVLLPSLRRARCCVFRVGRFCSSGRNWTLPGSRRGYFVFSFRRLNFFIYLLAYKIGVFLVGIFGESVALFRDLF
jgi:hypothetical protein